MQYPLLDINELKHLWLFDMKNRFNWHTWVTLGEGALVFKCGYDACLKKKKKSEKGTLLE